MCITINKNDRNFNSGKKAKRAKSWFDSKFDTLDVAITCHHFNESSREVITRKLIVSFKKFGGIFHSWTPTLTQQARLLKDPGLVQVSESPLALTNLFSRVILFYHLSNWKRKPCWNKWPYHKGFINSHKYTNKLSSDDIHVLQVHTMFVFHVMEKNAILQEIFFSWKGGGEGISVMFFVVVVFVCFFQAEASLVWE